MQCFGCSLSNEVSMYQWKNKLEENKLGVKSSVIHCVLQSIFQNCECIGHK